jgi:hypothetical protein
VTNSGEFVRSGVQNRERWGERGGVWESVEGLDFHCGAPGGFMILGKDGVVTSPAARVQMRWGQGRSVWARITSWWLATDRERMRSRTWRSAGFVGGQDGRPATWNSRRAVEHARSNGDGDDDLSTSFWRVIPKRYHRLGWAELGVAAHWRFLFFFS